MASKAITFTYKKCNGDDIVNWCIANKETEWLKSAATDNQNFLKLKRAFFEKFAPELIPVAKPKSKPLWQKIANL